MLIQLLHVGRTFSVHYVIVMDIKCDYFLYLTIFTLSRKKTHLKRKSKLNEHEIGDSESFDTSSAFSLHHKETTASNDTSNDRSQLILLQLYI